MAKGGGFGSRVLVPAEACAVAAASPPFRRHPRFGVVAPPSLVRVVG